MGREPRTVAVHHHDPDGRLVATVTTSEPEWDDEGRAWLMALLEFEAGLCGSCGHHLSLTTGATNEERFHAGAPVRCHRCTESLRASAACEKNTHSQALMVPVHRDLTVEGVGGDDT